MNFFFALLFWFSGTPTDLPTQLGAEERLAPSTQVQQPTNQADISTRKRMNKSTRHTIVVFDDTHFTRSRIFN